MEVVSDFRNWGELIPDTLGVIFSNLSVKERLTVIPRVCKSWAQAVNGPYCWQEIKIEDLGHTCEVDRIDRMLEMLITRSSGSLRKLCVHNLHSERMFTFIAENAGSLQSLQLPRSSINDSIVEKITRNLSMISFLDVSNCIEIGAHALETIGKNLKLLEGLCRNCHPALTYDKPLDDDEAFAIASTMPKLKRLEMVYHVISEAGVLRILSYCQNLEFLDLRGCWGVKFDKKFVKQNFPKLEVLGPLHCITENCFEGDGWGAYSDISDSSESSDFITDSADSLASEFVDSDLEELEFRLYEGVEDAGLYWPPSP